MRHVIVLLVTVALAAPAVHGEEPAERAAIEHTRLPDRVFQGAVVALELHVRADHFWFAEHGVSRFAQATDLPFEIDAPALRGPSGTTLVPWSKPSDAGGERVVVNGEIAELHWDLARVTNQGWPTWRHLKRRWVAERLGALEIAAPTLRFTYTETFGEDALGNRVPGELRQVVLRGQSQLVTVAPLPPEGRPADFGGAIGRFTVAAAAERTEVEVGQTFRLTLTIEGEGNLEFFEAPRLDPSDGFHVYGVTDDRGYPKRTVVYDLAPLRADVTAAPALSLSAFDPNPPGSYRTVSSAPIPLTVRAAAGNTSKPVWKRVEVDETGGGWDAWLLPGLGAALVLVGGALWLARRRRYTRAATSLDPDAERLRGALLHLRAQALHPDADLSEPFAEVLAARLRQPRAAAVAPDIGARLTAAGVGPDVATEAATTMERLVGARYGGAALDPAARDRIFTIAARVAEAGGQPAGR